MVWNVFFHDDFDEEFEKFKPEVQDAILVRAKLLELEGHNLGRPHADTLIGSKHANMKELRLYADNGVWRIAFAFDPLRNAIILVGGDKSGISEKRFYKKLIAKADARFDNHLQRLNEKGSSKNDFTE